MIGVLKGDLVEVNSSLSGLRVLLHDTAIEKTRSAQQMEKQEKVARKQGKAPPRRSSEHLMGSITG